MLSRLSYMFREMWASLRRNLTLTAAAIITASVSLLLFGLTLLIQRGFDNQLSQWSGGVKMIVYIENDASPEQLAVIREALESTPDIVDVPKLQYLDVQQSLVEAQRLFAADPETLQLLNDQNIPSQFKVVPTDTANAALLQQLSSGFKKLPKVYAVSIPSDFIEVLASLKGFIGIRLYLITGFLLLSAVLLIWNTIRTAIFARRREIEVMKLVGATNWFIRVPFMLEGLFQGFVGGVLASGAMLVFNGNWTSGVETFPTNSGLKAFVVTDGYPLWIVFWIVLLGMLVGAIGSGTAASRFLDV
ncbi:MAG: permease-like cell division protein FtsX [Actinomycetota bacterium]|jgi:cell division transport system permease protein